MSPEPKANILVVDDSPSKLLAMEVSLGELGQNVVTALSGREALRELLREQFAVILLDVNMPEMDGFETAALIRQRKSSAHVPIIFVTAYEDDAYATQGYSLGAVDYLLTPVVPEVLRAKVGVFVELFRQNARIKEQAAQQIALAQEQVARRTAEAANRMKDEFLAVLSHELRTPLNAILGWTQLLQLPKHTDNDLADGLEVIERNARAQAKIIEDLLDVSRVISGKLQLDLGPANVVDIINAAVAAVQAPATAKKITIDCHVDDALPVVQVDATRLQQVIWNLISNAVKFSANGGRVEVIAKFDDDRLEISVHDDGEGIAREFLPYVFDRFRQADASTKRGHGGLGLGLAIVRQLVELHGGHVTVASEGRGRGSTFTVRLPVDATTAAPPAVNGHDHFPLEGEVEENCSLAGLRILVVDDEADARDVAERILTNSQAEVRTADSAAQALELVELYRPHLLVSDIGMPGRDGYELIREIRRVKSPVELPALALTAYARAEEQQRAFAAGFQAHITKPVSATELTAAIAQVVRRATLDGTCEPRPISVR